MNPQSDDSRGYKKGKAQPDLITWKTSTATDFFRPKQTNVKLCGFTRHYVFPSAKRRDKCCCSGKLMPSLLENLKNENFLLTTERRGL